MQRSANAVIAIEIGIAGLAHIPEQAAVREAHWSNRDKGPIWQAPPRRVAPIAHILLRIRTWQIVATQGL